jgi:putative FmdB family regulatory protein
VPVYDYVCGSCGHRYEVFHGLNESGPHQCPLCEGPVTRAFVPPTIHFKGSGWAKKDRQSSGASARKAAAGSSKLGEPATAASSPGESNAGESNAGGSNAGGSNAAGESSAGGPGPGGSSTGDSASSSVGTGD